jgi:hypothetical protein
MSRALVLPLLLGSLAAPLSTARAQTLRGSHEKVERAYEYAQQQGVDFAKTRRDIAAGVRGGSYVPLTADANLTLKGVAVPYVLPATRDFIVQLAEKYRAACRAPMVVTSAMRPTTLQKRIKNGIEKSVHPTGMAVDLRAPQGKCRPWLRQELLSESRRGTVDATEERHPAHFHVIVFRSPT